MKNLILILFTTFVLSSCDKDGQFFAGKDQLPPETQTGANTVGCLVNGKVFLPKKEGINPEVNCFYQLVKGEYFFTMAFSDLRGIDGKTVSVQTSRINLAVGQVYILNKNPLDNADYTGGGGTFRQNYANKFYTNTIKTGELKIIKLDPANSIISGTFWFDAENTTGEKVEIRQGRFDWRY
nr:DUF6252 family protein [uncultured Flavobacterium sp.]